MRKIAILHTTPATVAPLNAMVKAQCPDIEIMNWVDDSILPALMEDISSREFVYEKLLSYAQYAQIQGAELIMNACSSVGEFQQYVEGKLKIPLIRVDDRMSDEAIKRGNRVAVLATIPTTMEPSCQQLRKKGGAELSLTPHIVDGAYQALKTGNKPLHDELITQSIVLLSKNHDVIYLAQASMADAVIHLDEQIKENVLYSTVFAVSHVADVYRLNGL